MPLHEAISAQLVLAFLVTGTLTLASAATSRAEPFVPRNDGEVLERLPVAPLDPAAQRLRAMRASWRYDPTIWRWRRAPPGSTSNRAVPCRIRATTATPRACWRRGGSAAEPPAPVAGAARHDSSARPRFPRRARRSRAGVARRPRQRAGVVDAGDGAAGARRLRRRAGAAASRCCSCADPLVAVTCLSSVDSLTGGAPEATTMLRGALARRAAAMPARAAGR